MVRLVAARADGDLAALRTAVDQVLRTRRFLDPRESMAWAHAARPVVAELDRVATGAPSRELVELVQRALGHVVKVILHADDSSGFIGDIAVELLRVHAKVCDTGVADPVKLARWMIRFRFEDQDFFEVDPVRYEVHWASAACARTAKLSPIAQPACVRCSLRARAAGHP